MKAHFPIVVLISGNGSNLQAMIDASLKNGPFQIAAVISNEKEAYGLKRAMRAAIKTEIIEPNNFSSRQEFDQELIQVIDQYHPELIVLAGFMRKLGREIVQHFRGKMINIHPSLLPKYPGLNTHNKVLEAHDKEHGSTIHFVTEDLDAGPIIAQEKIPVLEFDTAESLKTRIQELEHRLYPKIISDFAQGKIQPMEINS